MSALRSVIRTLDPGEGGADGTQICQIEMDGEARHYLVKRFAEKGRQRMQALREIRQCRGLAHPAVAPLIDHFEDAGTLVAIFEHADGVRLDEIMGYLAREGECLADSATWHLARQLFDALAATHELTGEDGRALHLVHGSLGPDRIYITWDARLCLHGVGLPTLFDDEGRGAAALAYHAPERRTGARPVARADVYSAALVIWSLLTGREPEAGVAPQNIARFCPEIPSELARGLDNALQDSPLRRTLSCRALEHIVTTSAGASEDCPELQWNMDLFRSIVEGQGEAAGAAGFSAPPPLITAPPADEEDGGRAAVVPGPGAPAKATDDSTVQRLSDLLEALPVGADSVPAPDGDEEDGWLLDVVRASTAGQEPAPRDSGAREQKPAAGGAKPAAAKASESPKPNPPDPAESVSAAETVPAGESTPPPLPPSSPPAARTRSTPPPLPSTPPPSSSTPPPLPSTTPPAAVVSPSSRPPALPSPSPPPAEPPDWPAEVEPPAAPHEAAGLFEIAPEPAPSPTGEGAAARPRWFAPAVATAVAVGVVVALLAFQPGLFGLSGDTSPTEPTGLAADPRTATPPTGTRPDGTAPPRAASAAAARSATLAAAASSSASTDPGGAPTASASASAAAGELPPVVDELGGDGSELLSFEGYLIVRSVAQVDVVVQGQTRGSTNRKLKTHCHQKNVRLREPASGSWLTPGEPVRIQCMGTTTVVINP